MNFTPQVDFALAGRRKRRVPESTGITQPTHGKISPLCPQRDFGKDPIVVKSEEIPKWFDLTEVKYNLRRLYTAKDVVPNVADIRKPISGPLFKFKEQVDPAPGSVILCRQDLYCK